MTRRTYHGKAPAGVDKASRVRVEATRDGIHDGHLAQRVDHVEHHDADDDEVDEQAAGPAVGEGAARADEEAGADGAADGDHVQVAALHAAVHLDDAAAVVARLEAVEADAQARHEGLLADGVGDRLVLAEPVRGRRQGRRVRRRELLGRDAAVRRAWWRRVTIFECFGHGGCCDGSVAGASDYPKGLSTTCRLLPFGVLTKENEGKAFLARLFG